MTVGRQVARFHAVTFPWYLLCMVVACMVQPHNTEGHMVLPLRDLYTT